MRNDARAWAGCMRSSAYTQPGSCVHPHSRAAREQRGPGEARRRKFFTIPLWGGRAARAARGAGSDCGAARGRRCKRYPRAPAAQQADDGLGCWLGIVRDGQCVVSARGWIWQLEKATIGGVADPSQPTFELSKIICTIHVFQIIKSTRRRKFR
jgi:hypothetical protein